MKFGLNQKEFELLTKTLITPLKKQGVSLGIFGSRARGDFKKFSDIDVLYTLNPSRPLPSGFIFLIKSDLEESRLPYKVDLVNRDELAESYKEKVLIDLIQL